MVSELMLQQTQVSRVAPKYDAFLAQFPTCKKLAEAPLEQVLRVWQGLGYNRRARFLREACRVIEADHKGIFPQELDQLTELSGIGHNTAAAILVYSFNQPQVFIETNVRTVYIHHFVSDRGVVHDKELLPLVSQTLDRDDPRTFYWALMDYGSYLKKTVGNLNARSRHYAKQSRFEGSIRQLRGKILRELANGPWTYQNLKNACNDARFEPVIEVLISEGFIRRQGIKLSVAA